MTKAPTKATSRPLRPFKIQVIQQPGYGTTYYVPRTERFPDAAAAQAEAIRRLPKDLMPEAVAGSQAFALTSDIVGGRVRYTDRWWKVDVVIRARHAFTVNVEETTEKRAIARARSLMPDRPTQVGVWALFSLKTPYTEAQALAA